MKLQKSSGSNTVTFPSKILCCSEINFFLKDSLSKNEILMSLIFHNCNKKIVRISAQKYKNCSTQTNKDISLSQIAPN